jgi:hypothetical protein
MLRRMTLTLVMLATLGLAGFAPPRTSDAWDGWYTPYYYDYGYWAPRRGYDYPGAPYYPGYGPPYYPGYGPPYTAGISPHYPYPRYMPYYRAYRPVWRYGPTYR